MFLLRLQEIRLASFVLVLIAFAGAQVTSKRADVAGANYSGMYSFLREGEFVQLTVENKGHVTGFVSRFGDSESDRGAFLDHFFKSGSLDRNQLTFTTDTVHGVSFDFQGAIERGDGKKPGDEGYYVLKGTLTEITSDDAKNKSSHPRQVALKSFPQDLTR